MRAMFAEKTGCVWTGRAFVVNEKTRVQAVLLLDEWKSKHSFNKVLNGLETGERRKRWLVTATDVSTWSAESFLFFG